MRNKQLTAVAGGGLSLMLLLACSQTSTETARNLNGNINSTSTANTAANLAATPTATPTASPQTSSTDTAPARISIEEARALVGKGEAVFVDVRGTDNYKQAHIKGAIDVPVGDIAARGSQLPKDKKLITYCT